MSRIAIVGAGFSGTLLALHLLRRCRADVTVTLIERADLFGPGLAYATGNPHHRLNVPAGNMSAFADRPRDFLDWLEARPDPQIDGVAPHPGSFAPRGLFGSYVRDLLLRECRQVEGGRRLELRQAAVTGLGEHDGAVEIEGAGGPLTADIAVLAIGNFPPAPPPGIDERFLDGACYRPDPWAPNALTGIDATAPVLLIGTGLTTIDMILALLDRGHRGPIHALSRRGLLPRAHLDPAHGLLPVPRAHDPLAGSLNGLVRQIRAECRAALAAGSSWHFVIDRLRPFTGDLWASLAPAERKRFLRHVRPWWDMARHRMPPGVAARIGQAIEAGQVVVHQGELQALAGCEQGITVRYRPRGTGRTEILTVSRVINGSGPGADYRRIGDPLVRALLDTGLVRPDPLRLGLDVTRNCALRRADGAISRRLFAVGPVTKGAFWEMVAVPDLRRQAELLARHLASVVSF